MTYIIIVLFVHVLHTYFIHKIIELLNIVINLGKSTNNRSYTLILGSSRQIKVEIRMNDMREEWSCDKGEGQCQCLLCVLLLSRGE